MLILSGCDKKSENNATEQNITFKSGSIIQDETAIIATDPQSGLMWQDQMYLKAQKNNDDDKIGDWKYAKEYCDKLDLDGYDDWRLPSIDELKAVIDNKNKPAFKSIFKNATNRRYWSSSPYTLDKNYAMIVDFETGENMGSHTNNRNFIRCVRNK